MKLESHFSFISNCRGNSDDITLVQTISINFTNRHFTFNDSKTIPYVFEANSITIRSCGIDILKTDVVFLR